jgi:hypothetical protein
MPYEKGTANERGGVQGGSAFPDGGRALAPTPAFADAILGPWRTPGRRVKSRTKKSTIDLFEPANPANACRVVHIQTALPRLGSQACLLSLIPHSRYTVRRTAKRAILGYFLKSGELRRLSRLAHTRKIYQRPRVFLW